MKYEFNGLTNDEQRRFSTWLNQAQSEYRKTDFIFITDTNDTSKKRDFFIKSKYDDTFIYMRDSMTQPISGWINVLNHSKRKSVSFEDLQLQQIPDNPNILNEVQDFLTSVIDGNHEWNVLPENITKKLSNNRNPKYSRYTDKMIEAIRDAIDASDVKDRYADAWNGFTVSCVEHSDDSQVRIDFMPKDGASYSIAPITLKKAGSYARAGEVRRVMKIINSDLPLILTEDAVMAGVATCLEAIKQQIKDNAPWVVPSDLTAFVGTWTMVSYNEIIADSNEPLALQQSFVADNMNNSSSESTSMQLMHGTRVIYNPTSDKFCGFDGNFAYTVKRTASILENADGYRKINQIIADSDIDAKRCRFRYENWEFHLIDIIVSSSIGEQTISIDINNDKNWETTLAARLEYIKNAEDEKTRQESEALIKTGLIGNVITDAIIETVHANSRITPNTIIKLLRGLKVNRSYRDYDETVYEGKLKLANGDDIAAAIDDLIRIGILDEHDVKGDYGWFTVLTINDAKYEQYANLINQLIDDNSNIELMMALPFQWSVDIEDNADSDKNINANADTVDNTNSTVSTTNANDEVKNVTNSDSTAYDTSNGETNEKTQNADETDNGANNEKKDGEMTSEDNTVSDEDDTKTNRIEDEANKITYLINHPAVLSFSWDNIHEWLRHIDTATEKYLSVMKKLEQVKARKSLINKMLDAATGNDIKKAAKKAAKAAKDNAASGNKENKTAANQNKPEYRIVPRAMGKNVIRYVVVSKDGKTVLDDAQGYGFKSQGAAERCYSFKSSGKGAEVKKAEEWWRQNGNRNIIDDIEDASIVAVKEGDRFTTSDLVTILNGHGIDVKEIGIKPSILFSAIRNVSFR